MLYYVVLVVTILSRVGMMGDTWEPGGVATDTTDTTDTTRVAPQLLLGLRCYTPTILRYNMLHPNYSGVANVTPQPLTTLTTHPYSYERELSEKVELEPKREP